jgi:hypothetical protein
MRQNFLINGDAFSARIWKDGDMFIAECLELETMGKGKTIKSARLDLQEASRLFLEEKRQKK